MSDNSGEFIELAHSLTRAHKNASDVLDFLVGWWQALDPARKGRPYVGDPSYLDEKRRRLAALLAERAAEE